MNTDEDTRLADKVGHFGPHYSLDPWRRYIVFSGPTSISALFFFSYARCNPCFAWGILATKDRWPQKRVTIMDWFHNSRKYKKSKHKCHSIFCPITTVSLRHMDAEMWPLRFNSRNWHIFPTKITILSPTYFGKFSFGTHRV